MCGQICVTRIESEGHCFEVTATYPNQCTYTVKAGLGQDALDTQVPHLNPAYTSALTPL